MLLWLWLLFVVVPIVELTILVWVGGRIGALETVGMVIAVGLLGAWLVRREGMRAWLQIQDNLRHGRAPGVELLEALLIMWAGILLITPGLLTDVVAISMLVPAIRRFVGRRLGDYLKRRVTVVSRPSEPDIVDAEWRDVTDRDRN